jgi:hypothetical protein
LKYAPLEHILRIITDARGDIEMKYFLAPRSGEKSYKNFESTIRNGVPMSRIEKFLTIEGKQKLLSEDVIYAWGNREGTRSQWESMDYGDTVIFYAHRKLVMIGEVYYKQHSNELALAMWPPDDNGNPWAYTFFLKNLRFISIPMQAFNVIAGYKSNYIVQGFSPITKSHMVSIDKEYGTVEKMLNDSMVNKSDEMPRSNEAIHVNVNIDVIPEVITSQNYAAKKIQERLKLQPDKKYKTDFLERNRINAVTGSKGEELVLKYESDRLMRHGKADLAKKIVRVSVEDDSKGYDILSYEDDGRERYIEVKTSTNKSDAIRFFMSQNEYDIARTCANYYVYFVDGANDKTPRISIIKDPIKNRLFLIRTDSYVIEGYRK